MQILSPLHGLFEHFLETLSGVVSHVSPLLQNYVDFLSNTLSHPLSPLAVSYPIALLLVVACLLVGSHKVLRWPLLLVALVHVAVELTVVVLLVAALNLWDIVLLRVRPGKQASRLLKRLESARTWGEFHAAGRELDASSAETVKWKATADHPQYNAALIARTLDKLRAARHSKDYAALLDILGTCVRKSYCGIDAEALYSRCHTGTKRVVELYVDEVVGALGDLRSKLGTGDETFDDRVRGLLYRSQRVFGRTCLSLSGGGGLANFSWGVARALYDQKLLPTLICGTSAGAVVGAALCTHTDAELDELLTPGWLVEFLTSFDDPRRMVLRRWWEHGHMYDAAKWKAKIQRVCNHAKHPDLTFAEAFKLTGREFCVTVTARRRHEPPLVLSRLSAPDVTIASAVLATVAMPFLIPAQSLVCKGSDGELRPWAATVTSAVVPPSPAAHGECDDEDDGAGGEWRDGSIVHDTPREQLAQHFGASYTILHQCNPHVVPLFIALRPTAGRPAVSRLQRGRSEWRGGFALSALLVMLLTDAHKWLNVMRELEIMPLVLDTDWSNLFLQQFTGDVTIYPPMRLRDYLRILTDPTPVSAAHYIAVGQRECWRKMPMLATRLRIAGALRAAQTRLNEVRNAAGRTPASTPPPTPPLLPVLPDEGAGMKRSDSMQMF